MKKLRIGFLFLILILLLPASAVAFDFGLLLNLNGSFGNASGEEPVVEFGAGVIPRFSMLIGDSSSLFISAMMTVGYKENLYYVPELMRTEFSFQKDAFGLSVGRFNYSDPLGFIANGLFDGFRVTHSSSAGRIGFGAWYSGFQYKKTANITMTSEDENRYVVDLDYADFVNTYFAPSRVLVALDWEHPSIAEVLRLKIALLGQLDLSDKIGKYHSEYFVIKAALPVNSLLIEVGGSFGAAQVETTKDDYKFVFSFAFDAGLFWTLPTAFNSRLSLTARYSSGAMDDTLQPFVPISTVYSGNIFQAKMIGLTAIALNYTARFSEQIGASLTASYFVRNDLVTQNSYPISGGDGGFFLGPEAYLQIIWSPVSDLQLVLGGGAFFPMLGDNWPNDNVKWKVGLQAVLALY